MNPALEGLRRQTEFLFLRGVAQGEPGIPCYFRYRQHLCKTDYKARALDRAILGTIREIVPPTTAREIFRNESGYQRDQQDRSCDSCVENYFRAIDRLFGGTSRELVADSAPPPF